MTGQNADIRSTQQAGEWNDSWDINVFANDYAKLKEIVNAMQPGKVETAGSAYSSVATRMYETVDLIWKQASRLAEHWGGEDADAAMTQLQKAYEQANEIYDKSYTTGGALNAHAGMQRSWQDSMQSGFVADSGWVNAIPAFGQGMAMGRNAAAEDLMKQLQQHTMDSNENFPTGIKSDNPNVNPNLTDYNPNQNVTGGSPSGGLPGGSGAGSFPGGGGAGTLPGGGGAGSFPGGGSGAGSFPGGSGAGDLPGGSGTDLAGLPGGGSGGGLGGGGLGPGGVGGGGLGPGGVPGGGAGAGGMGAGGLGGGLPGGGALGKNGLGAGGMGMGGMPMGAGAGKGGNDDEHERTTWLTEDEDVWGADGDAAPPVIG